MQPGISCPSTGRTFAVVVPDEDLSALEPLVTAFGLDVLTLRRLHEHVVQVDGEGEILSAEAPAGLLGAIANSPEGARALGRAPSKLELFFETFGFDLLDLSKLDDAARDAALSTWLARRLVYSGTIAFGDVARVRRSLVVVRQEHEEAMERFAALEESTSRFSTPNRFSKLSWPASRTHIRLGSDTSRDGRGVRQLLPTLASGIASVEIQLSGPPTGSGGSLQVDLLVGGSTDPVHRWAVSAETIRGGWLRLFLDRATTSREQDATLKIAWEGSGSVSLNLSRPLPLDEVCGVLDDGRRLSAPLALKVWGMVPGATVSQTVNAASPAIGAPPESPPLSDRIRFPLAADDLEAVSLLSPSSFEPGFEMVAFRGDETDVRVHPFWDAPTVAIIRNLNVRDLERLSAVAYIERSESNPVEFGLAAVTQRPTYDAPGELIRHWTAAEAQTYTEVVGSVDVANDRPVDLLLATRMLDGAAPSFAWSYFKRIEVLARSETRR